MRKANWIKASILGCFIITVQTAVVLAEQAEKTAGEVRFTEDFGDAAGWYRWNSPVGWYCRSSSVPGIFGGLASINDTPEGMSGAYLMCGYRKSYSQPYVDRLLPENMVISEDGIVVMELTVHICGTNAVPHPAFGLVSGAKLKKTGTKTYLDWHNPAKNFFGVRMLWHSPRKGISINRLVMQTKAGPFGEEYIDNKHYLRPGVSYRICYKMDIGADRVCLDIKTYKDGKWSDYKQVFGWKPAGIDLSDQGINAIVLTPSGNTRNFAKFDDLLFSFTPNKKE